MESIDEDSFKKDLSTQLVKLNISDLLSCIVESEKMPEFVESISPEEYNKLFKNTRNLSTVIEMRNFHNWIKLMLITNIRNKYYIDNRGSIKEKIALLDISVGRGGDLAKWDKAQITHVFGFDPSVDSIKSTDPNNPGAKERLKNYKFQKDKLKKTNVEFDVGYATMPLGDPRNPQIPNIDSRIFNFISKKKLNGFDLISCQFSLHYFFVNEIAIRNVLSLVSKYLKPGGYFFGTSIDGEKIVKYFQLSGNPKTINGKLYSITREFPDKLTKSFGNQYKFTIYDSFDKTNYFNTIPESIEYLVDFNKLNTLAAEYSLEPVKINFFEKIIGSNAYSSSRSNVMSFEEVYSMNLWTPREKEITNDELQISFLNSAFVFRKK